MKVAFERKLSDELYTLAQFLLLKSTFTNRMSYIPEIFLSHTVTCYLCHVDVVMLLADMVHHRTKCHLIWTLSTVHCLVVVQRCLSSAMLCFF